MWAGGQVQDTINTEISTPLRQALVSHVIPQLIDTAVGVYAKKTMLPTHSVALGRACVSSDHAAPEAYARSLLAQDFDIHPNQIKQWRDQLLEGATGVFGEAPKAEPEPTIDVKTLHAKIGELTLENDFLSGALGKAGLLASAKR